MDATLEPQPLQVRNPGSQNPQKAIVAQALLAKGYSKNKAAKLAGLSEATVRNIAKAQAAKGFSSADEERSVQAVKAHFQSKCILKADSALDLLNDEKMSDASAGELAKVALELAKAGGMLQAQPVEHYYSVIHKFRPVEKSNTSDPAKQDIIDVTAQPPNSTKTDASD